MREYNNQKCRRVYLENESKKYKLKQAATLNYSINEEFFANYYTKF